MSGIPKNRFYRRARWVTAFVLLACDPAASPSPSTAVLQGARAALSGEDGALTVTAANTVLNAATRMVQSASAGDTSISLANAGDLETPLLGPLGPGDLLLVVQMQGATISTNNNNSYGTITNLGNAGHFEWVRVGSRNGNTVNLDASCAGGLAHAYTASGNVQVVRVPQLSALTVAAGASITAAPWNGQTGGVLALHVSGQVTLEGTLDATGKGFRGGVPDNQSDALDENVTTQRSNNADQGGEKGESVAGPASTLSQGRYGRGAPANGGGGGNSHNAGGGGGANASNGQPYTGQGVMDPGVTGAAAWARDPGHAANGAMPTNSAGGGRGGYTFSDADENALSVAPGSNSWLGNERRERGGLGGRPLAPDAASRLFLGGGGGAGDGNNNGAGAGGAGGGLVLLRAGTVSGGGSILANGEAGGNVATSPSDAPGGGGGGGSVVVRADVLSGVTVRANGGEGGTQFTPTNTMNREAEGPGGGGGGGFVAVSGGTVTRTAVGGAGGVTQSASLTEFPSNGATRGADGVANATAVGFPTCGASADVAVAISNGETTVTPGGLTVYTITVTNPGTSGVGGVRVEDILPAALTNASWTCSAVAPGACSVANGTGNVTAVVNVPPGGTVTITLTATVAAGTVGNVSTTVTAAMPLDVTDTNPANNTATDTDAVAVAGADLSAAIMASAAQVTEGGTLSFTITATNNGPGLSGAITAIITLPPGSVVNNATGTGWSCATNGTTVTCTHPGGAGAGALPAITVDTTANAESSPLTTSVTVTSPGDGNAANNTASIMTTVVPVNDPPTVTVPGAQATLEDTAVVFSSANGNAIQLQDVDAGAGTVRVTLVATGGVLTLGTATGLTFVTGDGTGDGTVVFEGTLAQVQAALDGLNYTPDANSSTGGVITVTLDDRGNTGGQPLVAMDSVTVTVGAVNDGPVLTLPGPQRALANVALPFGGQDGISIEDVDSGAGALTVTITATGGTVSGSTTSGVTFVSGDGTADATITVSGTQDDLNAFLASLSFTADGSTTSGRLDVTVDDGGNTGSGGVLGAMGRVDITVETMVTPDADMDGLTDALETQIGTNPMDADSDDDGVLDGAEPNFAGDADGDGLINALDDDSDNDLLKDGTELGVTTPSAATNVGAGSFVPDDDPATRTNPLEPDTDRGGVPDGTEDTNRNGRVDTGERDPNLPVDDLPVGSSSSGGSGSSAGSASGGSSAMGSSGASGASSSGASGASSNSGGSGASSGSVSFISSGGVSGVSSVSSGGVSSVRPPSLENGDFVSGGGCAAGCQQFGGSAHAALLLLLGWVLSPWRRRR